MCDFFMNKIENNEIESFIKVSNDTLGKFLITSNEKIQ